MSGIATAIVVGGGLSYAGAKKTAGAMESGAEATLQAQREAAALSTERFGEARELLTPYVGEARTAREQLMIEMGLAPGEAGTAYMETPGYQTLLEERQRGVEQAEAGAGTLYSGRRMKAAADVGGATQSQYYTNYMNMLTEMGSPSVATNLASLGTGQAATMGAQQIAAQQVASGLTIGAAETTQAATADIFGGATNLAASYIRSQPPPLSVPPPLPEPYI
jgi:hypothetical protein